MSGVGVEGQGFGGHRALVVGLGPNELRSYKMRTSRWTLLDMKCFKFEFGSTNHLFTNNYSPSRRSDLVTSKFVWAKSHHNGSTTFSSFDGPSPSIQGSVFRA